MPCEIVIMVMYHYLNATNTFPSSTSVRDIIVGMAFPCHWNRHLITFNKMSVMLWYHLQNLQNQGKSKTSYLYPYKPCTGSSTCWNIIVHGGYGFIYIIWCHNAFANCLQMILEVFPTWDVHDPTTILLACNGESLTVFDIPNMLDIFKNLNIILKW